MPVCVTGMHRSGASLVGRVLQLCDLYLGEDRGGRVPDNPEGFVENVRFRNLDDAILAALGGGWDLPPLFPADWQDRPQLAPLARQARTLTRLFRSKDPWGWKSCRSALTLPFWRSLLPDLQVIICVRDPREVALSMQRRTGCSPAFALKLWEAYNRQLLAQAADGRSLLTLYAAYHHDAEAELRRVLAFLGLRLPERAISQASRVASPCLRHFREGSPEVGSLSLAPDLQRLYAGLTALGGPIAEQALRVAGPPSPQVPHARVPEHRSYRLIARWEPRARWEQALRLVRRRGCRALWEAASRKLPLQLPRPARVAGRRAGTSQTRPAVPDVLVFAAEGWRLQPARTQQLAAALAGDHRVFYVRTQPGNGSTPRVRQVQGNLHEVALPATRQKEALAALRHDMDVVEAVCLLAAPECSGLALHVRQAYGWRILIDLAASRCHGWNQAPGFPEVADAVLVASPGQAGEHCPPGAQELVLANGGDFEHFRFPPSALARVLQAVPQPLVGCHLTSDDDVDIELVCALAEGRSDLSIVLVGRLAPHVHQALAGRRNVHLVGEQPYGELPAWLHALRLGIVPLRGLRDAPPQLLDLLSAGLPVVAPDVAPLHAYREHVRLAEGPASWLAALDEAMADVDVQRRHARYALARSQAWKERAAILRGAIPMLYPKASIVIITHNNADYTQRCLESIRERTVYPNYEVMVVDNASTDGTRELLRRWADSWSAMRAISDDDNAGFPRACNQGLAAVTGEYLVLLNNDTIVTRGWLSRLIAHLRDPQVGLVGPVTNSATVACQVPVTYLGVDEMPAFAARYVAAHEGERVEVGMMPFFCVAFRRSLYQEIGPLDERFGIGLCEDRDYARRVREAGLRVVCAHDAFVHHYHHASFATLGQDVYNELFERNRRLYEEKWGTPWEPGSRQTG